MQIISANGVLLRSLPNPLTPADHIRIRTHVALASKPERIERSLPGRWRRILRFGFPRHRYASLAELVISQLPAGYYQA